MYLKVRAAFGSFHSVRSFGICILYDLVFIRVRVGCILFPTEFMCSYSVHFNFPFLAPIAYSGHVRLLTPSFPFSVVVLIRTRRGIFRAFGITSTAGMFCLSSKISTTASKKGKRKALLRNLRAGEHSFPVCDLASFQYV